jgi:hypothetical protein
VGSGRVGHGRNCRIQKAARVRKAFKPSVPGFRRRLILRTSTVRPRRSSHRDSPCAICVELPHIGSTRHHYARRRVASAISRRSLPAVRRQLQNPQPTADPSVPSSPICFTYSAPSPQVGLYLRIFSREKTYRTCRAGDLSVGVRILCFSKTLRTMLPDSS